MSLSRIPLFGLVCILFCDLALASALVGVLPCARATTATSTLQFVNGARVTVELVSCDDAGLTFRTTKKETTVAWRALTDASAFLAREELTPRDDAAKRITLAEFARERHLYPESMEQYKIALALGGIDRPALDKLAAAIQKEETTWLIARIDGLLKNQEDPVECLSAIKQLKERYPIHERNAVYRPHIDTLTSIVSKGKQEGLEFTKRRALAAEYYDGNRYVRAAAQFKLALEIRPEHFGSQLGYAYSLSATRTSANLELSIKFMHENVGKRVDDREELRRTYGLAESHRLLAMFHRRRATKRKALGLTDEATSDVEARKQHAQAGLDLYEYMLVVDMRLQARSTSPDARLTASSLALSAHAGVAVCSLILGNRENQAPFARAVVAMNEYARTAATARRAWETRREPTMDFDPVKSTNRSAPAPTATAAERERYDQKVKNTVEKEALVRQALVETYMYLERFDDAIEECTKILQLDGSRAQLYAYRARCYALMDPPKWERALENMKSFQSQQDLTANTQEVTRVSRMIRQYEAELRKQKREEELDAG